MILPCSWYQKWTFTTLQDRIVFVVATAVIVSYKKSYSGIVNTFEISKKHLQLETQLGKIRWFYFNQIIKNKQQQLINQIKKNNHDDLKKKSFFLENKKNDVAQFPTN